MTAAKKISDELAVPVNTVIIGPGREVIDMYFGWRSITSPATQNKPSTPHPYPQPLATSLGALAVQAKCERRLGGGFRQLVLIGEPPDRRTSG